jgi:hypothetical protein
VTLAAAAGSSQTNTRQIWPQTGYDWYTGRDYLVYSDVEGIRERFTALIVDDSDTITAREPLANNYPIGATVCSTRITQPLSTSWVADASNLSGDYDPNPRYRWRLAYVVSSVSYIHDLYFDLVRYAARHDVSPMDVDRRSPGWIDRLPTYYREDQGRAVIDEAYRAIKFDLYNLSTPDQSIRNREVVNELVTLRAIEMVHQDERAGRAYQSRLEQLIAWAKVAVSKDSTGGASLGDVRPIWRR